MNALLMHPDRDFRLDGPLPVDADALVQDLELETLYATMAGGDKTLLEVARRAVLLSLTDPAEIIYRQDVLRDSIAHPDAVVEIYNTAVEALLAARRVWHSKRPDSMLHGAVSELEIYVDALKHLRQVTDEHAGDFHSAGFTRFFRMLASELDDDYFAEIDAHLVRLRFRDGVLLSAQLGTGNKGRNYVLRSAPEIKLSWFRRVTTRRSPYSFQIAERDEAGFKALQEIRGRGIVLVAQALEQSAARIKRFLQTLQTELAFYLACVNLQLQLTAKGEPICFPVPVEPTTTVLTARELYDVCLSLMRSERVVGNDIDADGKSLVMITGANQGGKSTFLRSIGIAQLMMQCGMFVPAESFVANVTRGVFTHFKREEDADMKSGKLDEELNRMSAIADEVAPGCTVLFNESFAATNEREGAEISRQIIRALREAGVKVLFVTHLYDLAHSLFVQHQDDALFLRAERDAGGTRTFRIVPGEPLPTSFGHDIYRRIFESSAASG